MFLSSTSKVAVLIVVVEPDTVKFPPRTKFPDMSALPSISSESPFTSPVTSIPVLVVASFCEPL